MIGSPGKDVIDAKKKSRKLSFFFFFASLTAPMGACHSHILIIIRLDDSLSLLPALPWS